MTGILLSLLGGKVPAGSDPYFEYTTLLLPGNGTNGAQNNTFLDGSTNNFTITRNGNTTQGTFSPFSQTGWSGAFNTSTTYLTVTDTSNLRFGSSNFTIEAFVYRAASGATQTIASKGASTPTGWVFQISSADKLVFTDTSTSITGATSLAANTWYYVAVVRAGTGSNQTTLYVNAVSDATGTSATTFSQTDNMKIGADRSNTNFANGYISNLRLSNTNRTISSTPTSALAADSNTIFLGLYNNRFQYTDSTAAFTNMSVTGTPSVQAFSPFNPTASWSAATYGGSGYFDGTGDYIVTPTNAALSSTLLASDFTIEMWIYLLQAPSGGTIWTNSTANSDGFTSSYIYSNLSIGTGKVGVNEFTSAAGVLKLNEWTHFACVRNGATVYIYVNGVQVASGAAATYLNTSAAKPLTFGQNYQTSPTATNAYLSGIRVVSSAVYTANFTPPTAPPTAITNTSLLLNFTNAGIYDATSKNDLETVGNAQISTAQSKWGGSSMYFDGTGDLLSVRTTSDLQMNGSFTWEAWLYLISLPSAGNYKTLWAQRNTASQQGGPCVVIDSSGNLLLFFANSTATGWAFESFDTGLDVSLTQWQHIALVKNGTSVTLYKNGTGGTSTTSSSAIGTAGNTVIMAGAVDGSQAVDGYMQDFRITKGYARYTSNFTAPTAAFPTL